jgi:hypothetical protein
MVIYLCNLQSGSFETVLCCLWAVRISEVEDTVPLPMLSSFSLRELRRNVVDALKEQGERKWDLEEYNKTVNVGFM